MAAKGFRSGKLREIYEEAIRQGWKKRKRTGNGHIYLLCPHAGCTFSEPFTITANEHSRTTENTLRDLRRHGFRWQGKPAKHEPIVPRQKEKA